MDTIDFDFPIREEDRERLRLLVPPENQELIKLIMEIAWNCFATGGDQALQD